MDHEWRRRSSQIPPYYLQQAQYRPARQASLGGNLGQPDPDELLRDQVPEAPYLASQLLSPATVVNAVTHPNRFQQYQLGGVSQVARYIPRFAINGQALEAPRSELRPAAPAHKPTLVLPNVATPSTGVSDLPQGPVNHLQVILYGEVDPKKPWKRKDTLADKQRKEEMSKVHGACLKCRKARKRCNGEKVCNRCRRAGLNCIRACNSCSSNNKRGCDEGACCKNCQRAGMPCVRPADSRTEQEVLKQPNLAGGVHKPLRTTKSTAQVNKHTMLETARRIQAPTAWGITFDMPPGPPYIDNPGIANVGSDSDQIGSQPYSQQSTDVDLQRTFTNHGSSTKVASEHPSIHLEVPGKTQPATDLWSGTTDSTSHFQEAMHFSDQGSPPLKAVADDPWNVEGLAEVWDLSAM